jgi:polyhydroxyalkanoate synthesis repressor PhaR
MRTIIRYANRKLYDKTTKGYVTLKDLETTVNNGEHIKVISHKNNKDITYQVLVKVLANKLNNELTENTDNIVSLINKG